jgi:mono/diheme cytochrome c family protein
MKRSWWRTGPPLKHTQPVLRLTVGQLLRQGAVLLFLAALWGGILLILLGATRSSNVAFVAEQGTPERKATSTVVANNTPTVATATLTPTSSTTATRVAATTVTASATATVDATSTPTPVAASATLAPTGTVTTSISFQRDVLPIFTQICVKCHGGDKTEKSLVLKTYNDLMQGSENGPVVEPGDPSNSLLVDMIIKGKMPKNGPKLLPKQIQTIVDWIKAGAPDN